MTAFGLVSLPENTGELASWLPYADKLPAWLVERFPRVLVDAIARYAEPAIVARMPEIRSKGGGSAQGWVIGCPMSPRQATSIPLDFFIKRLGDTVKAAEDCGANVLAFDELDRILAARNLNPYEHLGVAATTGGGLRIAGGLHLLKTVAFRRRIDIIDDDTVIVGADREVGAICARLWSRHSRRLTLVGEDRFRLEALRRRILSETGLSCKVSGCLSALLGAAIVIDAAGIPIGILNAKLDPDSVVLRNLGPSPTSIPAPGISTCPDNSAALVQEYQSGGMHASGITTIDDVTFAIPKEGSGQEAHKMVPSATEAAVLAIEGYVEPPGPGRKVSLAWVEKLEGLVQKHGFLPVEGRRESRRMKES